MNYLPLLMAEMWDGTLKYSRMIRMAPKQHRETQSEKSKQAAITKAEAKRHRKLNQRRLSLTPNR